MDLYTWVSSDSMGDPELDKHHQVLIGLINDLYTAMMGGEGARASEAIYKRLQEYTRFHFEAEEREMYDARYPEFARHRSRHRDFTQQVEELAREFARQDGAPGARMLSMMRHWLRTHIRTDDMRFAGWLAAQARPLLHKTDCTVEEAAPAEASGGVKAPVATSEEAGMMMPDQATGERRDERAFS